MKNIAVLIDFTEGSVAALKQANALVKKRGGKLFGIHIVESVQKVHEAEHALTAFMNKYCDIPFDIHIAVGSLIPASQNALKKVSADLVIICTHGVKGMFQHLFGAHILKLIQGITFPCIVIQENSQIDLANTQKILLPIGPHPDFEIKIRQTADLAQTIGASIIIYEIDRPGADFENLLSKHSDLAKKYFQEKNVPYTLVIEEVKFISVGFSRQTLEYASRNDIAILSLMSSVSKNDVIFGFGDKENFLVNEKGIAIMACNA
jgi:hypothetical protein